jgi:hypothetical protein
MADLQRISLDEVVGYFDTLEDPRSTINRQHPLVSVVVIAMMAVLAGASGPTAIAKWAAMKKEILLQVLYLPNGIPGKVVFRRVLMLLQPGFSSLFLNWLRSQVRAAAAMGVSNRCSVDGKTARRSHDRRRPGRFARGQRVGQ